MYAQPGGPLSITIQQAYVALLNQMVSQGQCSQQEAENIDRYMQNQGIMTLANGIAQREPGPHIETAKIQAYVQQHLYDTLTHFRNGNAPRPTSFTQYAPANSMPTPQYGGYPSQQYGYPAPPPQQYGYSSVPQYVPPAASPVYYQAPSMGGMQVVRPAGGVAGIRETLPPPPVMAAPPQPIQPVPIAAAPPPPQPVRKPYVPPVEKETLCTLYQSENTNVAEFMVRVVKSQHTKGVEIFTGRITTKMPFSTPQAAALYVDRYFGDKLKLSETDADKRRYYATIEYQEALLLDAPHDQVAKACSDIHEWLRTATAKPPSDILSHVSDMLDGWPVVVARAIKRMMMREFIQYVRSGKLLTKKTLGINVVPEVADDLKVLREFAPGISEHPLLQEYTAAEAYPLAFEFALSACTKMLFENIILIDPHARENDVMLVQAFGDVLVSTDDEGPKKSVAQAVIESTDEHHSLAASKAFVLLSPRHLQVTNLVPEVGTQFSPEMAWELKIADEPACDLDHFIKPELDVDPPVMLIIQPLEPGLIQRTCTIARTIDHQLVLTRRTK
jgi:hypothetical protein